MKAEFKAYIRPASVDDVGTLADLITDLAVYEKRKPGEYEVSEARIERCLFGQNPSGYALLATDDSGIVIGYVLYSLRFVGFTTSDSLYVEDLYVKEEARGNGVGTMLLQAVGRIAQERKCLCWVCLVCWWNESAQRFYESIGMQVRSDIWACRLYADHFQKLLRGAEKID